MQVLENEVCRVEVDELGAELVSFYSKELGREYIWDAGEAWKRHAPVLFPNIGGFCEDSYLVDGKAYHLPAHGFARDMRFEVVEASPEHVRMRLTSSDETRAAYPFDFALEITFELRRTHLRQIWRVSNKGEAPMYFSIGAHPGFKLLPGTKLADYELLFDREHELRGTGVEGRLVTGETYLLGEPADRLRLTPEVFAHDTFIMQDAVSGVELTDGDGYRVDVRFSGFPVMAVWAPAACLDDAAFVCIEPWYGINDCAGKGVRELAQKELVQTVEAGGAWQRSLSYEILPPLTKGEQDDVVASGSCCCCR